MENEVDQHESRLAQLSMIYEANLQSQTREPRTVNRRRSRVKPTLISDATHLSDLSLSLTYRDGISVVAQGDSWFEYIGNDIIKSLSHRGFAIKNFGTAGDMLERAADLQTQIGSNASWLSAREMSTLLDEVLSESMGQKLT